MTMMFSGLVVVLISYGMRNYRPPALSVDGVTGDGVAFHLPQLP